MWRDHLVILKIISFDISLSRELLTLLIPLFPKLPFTNVGTHEMNETLLDLALCDTIRFNWFEFDISVNY